MKKFYEDMRIIIEVAYSHELKTEPTTVRHTLMVDASCDYGQQTVGVGIVVRQARRPGRNGLVVDQLCEAYRGVPPGLAEMFAVLRALEISAERGFRLVDFFAP